jgi:hypothetical protein
MSMKYFWILWLLSVTAFGQSPLKFDRKIHDFGSIKEEGGKVSTRFSFKHEGSDTLHITNVIVSCGCTSPQWPKQALAPGDTGSLLITYDPIDRPGEFEKHIGVEIDGNPNGTVRIQGFVEQRPPGPRDWYPARLGNLWFKHAPMYLGSVWKDSSIVLDNIIYNAGEKNIKIFPEQLKLPSFVRFNFGKTELSPKDTAHFTIHYEASQNTAWGYVVDSLPLPSNDEDTPLKPLAVSVLMKERFDMQAAAPKMLWPSTKLEFGEVKANTTETRTFSIKNEGQAPLKIRAIKPNCTCITVKSDKQEAAPGESIVLSVQFAVEDGRGHQRKVVTIISNDPKADIKNLIVTADIP